MTTDKDQGHRRDGQPDPLATIALVTTFILGLILLAVIVATLLPA